MPLIWIKDWDFKWQGDYGYAAPVDLPKGTKLVMSYLYDNSTNNIRNPNHPPKRIRFGLQSMDEMGELYFQAKPHNTADLAVLAADYSKYFFEVSVGFYEFRVKNDPTDEEALKRLGRALGARGKYPEAIQHLTEAVRLLPEDDEAHFDLASVYMRQGNLAQAYLEFVAVTKLNPDDFQAFGSIGIILAQSGKPTEARPYFETALRLNPEDKLSARYLELINSRLPK